VSDADSFIDEVTEEVRRDKLFAAMRKYGWIAVVVVLAIVGGTAWREYAIAQEEAKAQAFGDALQAAMESDAPAEAFARIEAPGPGGRALVNMYAAAEIAAAGDPGQGVAELQAIANAPDVPAIYRQIASYKALVLGTPSLPVAERRAGFEALNVPGQPLRLLAAEQLALIDVEEGAPDAAIDRLNAILEDSEVTTGLRRRASQLIVALGGDLPDA
jgi:hypothetical protein